MALRSHIFAGCCVALFLVGSGVLMPRMAAAATPWKWELPADHFKRLSPFQRSQYQKAARLHGAKDYKGAVPQWEKFRLEFESELDDDILAYITFMKGYSQQYAQNRHSAVKLYTEVLDFFPETVWVAAPALYYRGICHFENGDDRKGYTDMKTMVAHEDYRHHVLAAGALVRLADNHWRNTEIGSAIKYWKQTYDDFLKTNTKEAEKARDHVLSYYIREQKYDSIVDWLTNAESRLAAPARAELARHVCYLARNGFRGTWGKYSDSRASKREKEEDVQAFLVWFRHQRPFFESSGLWAYYDQILQFYCSTWADKKARDVLVDEAVKYIKHAAWEEDVRQSKYLWLSDRLRDARDFLSARALLGLIKDRHVALWKDHELTGRYEGKWKEAAATLEILETMADEKWTQRAKQARADIYRLELGRYEAAIKLYQELSAPPGTLWSIQECYRKWGKSKQAHATLVEIAGMFPPYAPRAVYTEAEYYRADGESKKAVSLYRQILKQWPRASEASRAHQRLEAFGIATGGGVVEED